jgi:hypothetical protein
MRFSMKMHAPLLVAALVWGSACGGDGEEVVPPSTLPPDAGTPVPDGGSSTPDGGAAVPDGGPAPDPGDGGSTTPPDVDAETPLEDTGPVEPPPADCTTPEGCFRCPPRNELELLNQCNDRSSAVFDNRARLPLLRPDGSLPPLP